MLDLPLHPILVHFPIALGMIIPVLMIINHFVLKTDGITRKNWLPILLLSFFCAGGTIAAAWSGGLDEEKVEKIVGEEAFEEHEEAGEAARIVAVISFLIAAAVFAKPNVRALGYIYFVASLLTAAAIAKTGHSGGSLVYKNGAARAHTETP